MDVYGFYPSRFRQSTSKAQLPGDDHVTAARVACRALAAGAGAGAVRSEQQAATVGDHGVGMVPRAWGIVARCWAGVNGPTASPVPPAPLALPGPRNRFRRVLPSTRQPGPPRPPFHPP